MTTETRLSVERIAQQDAGGCALATIAMIAGITYERAKWEAEESPSVLHGHDHDWADGTSHLTVDHILGNHGFYGMIRYASWAADGVWPPEPWAPIHYAQVQQPSGNGHFVVVLADGTVVDPYREGSYRLSDWAKVDHVCGLVRPGVRDGA